MIERILNYRRERTLSNEQGEGVPLPPEIEEGGLVEPQFPSWFPREPYRDIPTKTPYKDSIAYTPERVWEQRRRMRRINDTGKR